MNSHHYWDGYSHQELYDQIHGKGGVFLPDGAGVSGASNGQVGWGRLTSLMASARERTEAALAKADAVWEGSAADAMRSGVTPLAQWADDARAASTASQNSVDAHINSYSSAKNRMPEPVPVTSTANGDYGGIPAGFTHLFGGQTDQDKQEAAAQDAKAEAVRVMAGYEGESGVAQSSVGQFVPPPSVTVNVAPAEPKGSDVIPVGVSEWPGTGRVIDDSTQSAADSPGPGAAPPPGGSLKPPPPGNASASPGITTPSVATTAPPSVNPVTTGLGADQYRPNSLLVPPGGITVGGTPGERGAGSGGRGPAGRGFGGGFGEGGSAGRGPGAAGGARGAAPGAGALAEERFAGRAGAAGARGTSGMGMGPAGGRAEGDEDEEHQTAEYLRGSHDSFWDDSPPVAPSVIGDEEDD